MSEREAKPDPFPATALEILKKHLSQNSENANCSDWCIKISTLGGRGVFATKSITRGSLIFINKPLILGPRHDHAGNTYCSKCYKVTDCYPCDKCSLLLCSKSCESSDQHAKECTFIHNNWVLKPSCKSDSQSLAKVLVYLRSLMLSEEQITLLSTLQKNHILGNNDELDWLCSNYEIPKEQISYMTTVSTILKMNAFRLSNNPENQKVPLRGLYPLSSLMNHSCVSNTRNVFMEDCSMAVYASKDIDAGEEIVSCYTGSLWCTPARRCQLYKTKKFWCKCARCQDPTELGTNLSALKCFDKRCPGILLPVNSLDPVSDWRCDNCHALHSYDRVSTVQCVLGNLVRSLDLDGQLHLESPVLKKLAEFVPFSSHIFVDLRFRLVMKIGMSTGSKAYLNDLSESRLALKESLCRGILRVVAALGLGDAHHRGLLLYHLHATLAERARRCPDLYEELKPEIESTIDQAYNILQNDTSAPADLELRRRYLGPGCDKPQEERFFILDS
ncbi:hypothetical protein O0L34_g1443 [Tuta absoluta]|nr:hypothetical protein O0L34_g1443 [Tuta absoluta]